MASSAGGASSASSESSSHIGVAHDSSNDSQDTPIHSTTTPSVVPRSFRSSKADCCLPLGTTCRVRGKKCDEQREGDSCRACKRFKLQCLGWSPKRPDCIRDRESVTAFKARLKAQLARAGLISSGPCRGRLAIQAQRIGAFSHTLDSAFAPSDPVIMPDFQSFLDDYAFSSNLPMYSDGSAIFNSMPPLDQDHFGLMPAPADAPSSSVQSDLITHYFANVQKVQPFCVSDALADSTYTAVTEEPHGAVALAVCALADLHLKQIRVSQGLEERDGSAAETSHGAYFKNRALLLLKTNKINNCFHTDHDAIAALHLLSLAQRSGGSGDWETPFNILFQWLLEKNVHRAASDPWQAFNKLDPVAQLYVKVTFWLDVFSSLSAQRQPAFLMFWKRLLGEQGMFPTRHLRMEILTGCPDDALLSIAEVSALARWKAEQRRKGCLDTVDLVARGNAMERRMRCYAGDVPGDAHEWLGSSSGEEDLRAAAVFRQTAMLYLHAVLGDSPPDEPEIARSVDVILRLLTELPPCDLDRALVSPICLAGCMANDARRHDFFRERVRALSESYGYFLPVRGLMEAVWQKRDGGEDVDVREMICEQGLMMPCI